MVPDADHMLESSRGLTKADFPALPPVWFRCAGGSWEFTFSNKLTANTDASVLGTDGHYIFWDSNDSTEDRNSIFINHFIKLAFL